ncbi:DUF6228 family protein [Azospirillum canadense]|uniref:DUF6228 family protein n=1 Tax=Azospirillum canadense TaxID=403962 RepID=UPI00222620E2|nr:DUF6228 family protein [Azospirillum canadense]MCW2241617.1 hypothetical protein [Azospirillum canadense]
MFSIRSSESGREISFSNWSGERFHVELKGDLVSASTEVWMYADADADGLSGFFEELGGCDKPWQGQRSWASIERDFCIAASCTSLGNVTFEVGLRGQQSAPEEWRVSVGLVVEFGQLAQIARRAKTFFHGPGI